MSRDQSVKTAPALAIQKHLQTMEGEPYIQATMRALKKCRKQHYGPVCLLAARGLLLTEKGFRLRNLTNFSPQTPVSPPHPSVERITVKSLLKRPGLIAHFWSEEPGWARTLTKNYVVTSQHLAYVGLDEWSPFRKAVNVALVVGTCGLIAIPGFFMWDVYLRWGNLGGASTEHIDELFKTFGYTPRGKPPPLHRMPEEVGTIVNMESPWGALGEADKTTRR